MLNVKTQLCIIQLAGWLARYHSRVRVQIRMLDERERERNGEHELGTISTRAGQWNNSIALGGWARPSNLLNV